MQNSENYNFKLPDGTDKVSITDINKNFTDIDGYLAEHQTSISNLNKEIFVGGKGTLAFTVADNTTRLNELEKNGGTGGGVTPALYVRTASAGTVGGITWHIEKWNNGYARCWGDYEAETLDFSTVGATGLNTSYVIISLPESLFTDIPTFATIMENTKSEGRINTNIIGLDSSYVTLAIHRTDNSPTAPMTGVHFYIEVRGDCSLG